MKWRRIGKIRRIAIVAGHMSEAPQPGWARTVHELVHFHEQHVAPWFYNFVCFCPNEIQWFTE